MKKFLIAILSLFLASPSFALIKLNTPDIRAVVESRVDAAHQTNVLTAWLALVEENGGGLVGSDMWLICEKAGWNIRQATGKSKCQAFVSDLLARASVQGWAVCDADEVNKLKQKYGSDVQTYCYENTFKDVSVGKREATALAQAFIYNTNKDTNVVCSDKERNKRKLVVASDDYLQCVSGDKKAFYEFKFDSVTATRDAKVQNNLLGAVCKNIHGLDFQKSGHSAGGGYVYSWPDYCKTADATKCSQVNESLKFFGFSSSLQPSGGTTICAIDVGALYKTEDLNKVSGLDNFAFCKGIQLNANNTLDKQVLAYVERTLGKKVGAFSCDGTPKRYAGAGCHDSRDDIMTCYIDGVAHDFVFDDLSESKRRIAQGGAQGMDCIVTGGTYTGKRCTNLSEIQCNELAAANVENCPECKAVRWNNELGVCELPSSATATNIQKGVRIASTVGLAVGGAVVTVVTMGTGAAAVTAVVLVSAGAVAESAAEIAMQNIAQDWLLKVQGCKTAACAEEFLRSDLQKMVSYSKEFTHAEQTAIDDELAKMIRLIPDDSSLWTELAEAGVVDAAGNVVPKAQAWQIVRAVGVGAQILGGIVALGSQFVKTSDEIVGGVQRHLRYNPNMRPNQARPGLWTFADDLGGRNMAVTTDILNQMPDDIRYAIPHNGKLYRNIGRLNGGTANVMGDEIDDVFDVVIGGVRRQVRTFVVPGTAQIAMSLLPAAVPAAGRATYYATQDGISVNITETPGLDDGNVNGGNIGSGVQPGPGGSDGNDGANNGGAQPDDGANGDGAADNDTGAGSAPVVSSQTNNNTILPVPQQKKRMSGLAAAAIGVAGAGAVVGGALLIGNAMDKDDDQPSSGNQQALNKYNNLMLVAGGVLGNVGGKVVSLLPIETVYGGSSPIALIGGRAVVVVKYDGMTIPFMMAGNDGWRAFKAMDAKTDDFVELTSTDYSRLPQDIGAVRDVLNRQMPSSLIKFYSSPNVDGLMLPGASVKSYDVINNNPAMAGFLNGV